MKNILTASIISLFIISCAYNKDELPKPGNGTTSTGTSGTTVTYTSHAKAIIDAKCVICHAASPTGTNQSPFLDTYSLAFSKKTRIEARAIIQGTMAPGNPLPQTEKDTLQIWINQGALQ